MLGLAEFPVQGCKRRRSPGCAEAPVRVSMQRPDTGLESEPFFWNTLQGGERERCRQRRCGQRGGRADVSTPAHHSRFSMCFVSSGWHSVIQMTSPGDVPCGDGDGGGGRRCTST